MHIVLTRQRTPIGQLLGALVCSALLPFAAWAQTSEIIIPEPDAPLYPNLRVGAGLSWTHDAEVALFNYQRAEIRSGTNIVSPAINTDFTPRDDVSFNVGPTLSLAVGGRFAYPKWLHLELETGFTQQEANWRATDVDFRADLWQVPAIVNATVPWKITDSLEGFGGAGLGVMLGRLALDSQTVPVRDVPGGENTITIDGDPVSATFTYQAFAGLRYRLKPSTAISLSYRFRGTTPPRWTGTYPLDDVEGDWELEFASLFSHSVLLFFDWRW